MLCLHNTGQSTKMKEKHKKCVREINGTYRVCGLTQGSILTLDIGPVPGADIGCLPGYTNGPVPSLIWNTHKKPVQYRSEVGV